MVTMDVDFFGVGECSVIGARRVPRSPQNENAWCAEARLATTDVTPCACFVVERTNAIIPQFFCDYNIVVIAPARPLQTRL